MMTNKNLRTFSHISQLKTDDQQRERLYHYLIVEPDSIIYDPLVEMLKCNPRVALLTMNSILETRFKTPLRFKSGGIIRLDDKGSIYQAPSFVIEHPEEDNPEGYYRTVNAEFEAIVHTFDAVSNDVIRDWYNSAILDAE